MAQVLSSVNWTQRTPAGLLMPLTSGIPGIGVEMEGAMQQAPQPDRQFIVRIIRQRRDAGLWSCCAVDDAAEPAA
ncbi:MAG: hypothetical protein ABI605_19890 [Rhizobacter sp.]